MSRSNDEASAVSCELHRACLHDEERFGQVTFAERTAPASASLTRAASETACRAPASSEANSGTGMMSSPRARVTGADIKVSGCGCWGCSSPDGSCSLWQSSQSWRTSSRDPRMAWASSWHRKQPVSLTWNSRLV